MKVEEYYKYQAIARGLHSVEDVQTLVRANTRLYDCIILDWLPLKKDAAIYEVACGPGIFLHWLRSRGYTNIRGSDSSKAQIDLAEAGGLPAKLADSLLELRALEADSLDCIVGFDFYEHLPKEIMLDFISDTHRLLRPGGRLILRGPNGDSPLVGRSLFNDITHHWAMTSTAFRAVLQMVGFERVEFRDDALASIQRHRLLKVPITWLAQIFLRMLLRAATREELACLSASFFVLAVK